VLPLGAINTIALYTLQQYFTTLTQKALSRFL